MVTNALRTPAACDDALWSAGALWLAGTTPCPADVLAVWACDGLASVLVPEAWMVAEADLLESMEGMPCLARAGKLGPVLAHPEHRRAWWLLPPDAAEHLEDLPRLRLRGPGWSLPCPAPGSYAAGRCWLEQPDCAGRLTDAAALGAAFSGRMRLPAAAFS